MPIEGSDPNQQNKVEDTPKSMKSAENRFNWVRKAGQHFQDVRREEQNSLPPAVEYSSPSNPEPRRGISRRRFLRIMGVGLSALGLSNYIGIDNTAHAGFDSERSAETLYATEPIPLNTFYPELSVDNFPEDLVETLKESRFLSDDIYNKIAFLDYRTSVARLDNQLKEKNEEQTGLSRQLNNLEKRKSDLYQEQQDSANISRFIENLDTQIEQVGEELAKVEAEIDGLWERDYDLFIQLMGGRTDYERESIIPAYPEEITMGEAYNAYNELLNLNNDYDLYVHEEFEPSERTNGRADNYNRQRQLRINTLQAKLLETQGNDKFPVEYFSMSTALIRETINRELREAASAYLKQKIETLTGEEIGSSFRAISFEGASAEEIIDKMREYMIVPGTDAAARVEELIRLGESKNISYVIEIGFMLSADGLIQFVPQLKNQDPLSLFPDDPREPEMPEGSVVFAFGQEGVSYINLDKYKREISPLGEDFEAVAGMMKINESNMDSFLSMGVNPSTLTMGTVTGVVTVKQKSTGKEYLWGFMSQEMGGFRSKADLISVLNNTNISQALQNSELPPTPAPTPAATEVASVPDGGSDQNFTTGAALFEASGGVPASLDLTVYPAEVAERIKSMINSGSNDIRYNLQFETLVDRQGRIISPKALPQGGVYDRRYSIIERGQEFEASSLPIMAEFVAEVPNGEIRIAIVGNQDFTLNPEAIARLQEHIENNPEQWNQHANKTLLFSFVTAVEDITKTTNNNVPIPFVTGNQRFGFEFEETSSNNLIKVNLFAYGNTLQVKHGALVSLFVNVLHIIETNENPEGIGSDYNQLKSKLPSTSEQIVSKIDLLTTWTPGEPEEESLPHSLFLIVGLNN